MRLSSEQTARIADAFAELMHAGVPTGRMFTVLLRRPPSSRAREALEVVWRHVGEGRTFYEGFAARPALWPRYLIELVRAAERAGMLVEGFREAADHFHRLARVQRAAHRLWRNPVAVVLFGWLIRALLRLYFLGAGSALLFCAGRLRYAAPVVAAVLVALYVPEGRRWVDRLCLHVPLVAEMVRDLSLYQFTRCLHLLYVGAVGPAEAVRLAANAMSNRHLAAQIAPAAEDVRRGMKFSEALAGRRVLWPGDFIARLSQGEVAGQIEPVLARLAQDRRDALETRAAAVRQVLDRLVAAVTFLAITFEIYHIVMALGNR